MSSESARLAARESLSTIGTSLVSIECQLNTIVSVEPNCPSLTVMGNSELKGICADMEKVVSGVEATPVKARRPLDDQTGSVPWTDDLVAETVQRELKAANKK